MYYSRYAQSIRTEADKYDEHEHNKTLDTYKIITVCALLYAIWYW